MRKNENHKTKNRIPQKNIKKHTRQLEQPTRKTIPRTNTNTQHRIQHHMRTKKQHTENNRQI